MGGDKEGWKVWGYGIFQECSIVDKNKRKMDDFRKQHVLGMSDRGWGETRRVQMVYFRNEPQ